MSAASGPSTPLGSGRRSFLRSSGYATVTAASAVMLVALTMIAGRWLPASEYGKFSFAIALATIVETLMDIGLGPVTVRTVARDGEGAGTLFRHVLGLKIAWGALGLTALLIAAPLMRSDPSVIRACYLMGVSSAIRSYVLSARGLLQGLNRFDLEAVTVVADRGLLLILGTLVLVSGFGLLGLSLAFVAARLLMFVVVTVIVRRVTGSARPTYDRAVWAELQTAALPLGFFLITLTLYTYIDTVILGIMRTDAETGWYAASYRVYEGLMYAPSALATVLTPRFSQLFIDDPKGLRTMFQRSLLGSAAMAVLVGGAAVFLARPMMLLFYGAAYQPAVPPLQVLAGGSIFVFCTWILHSAAIAINLDRRLVATTAIGLATNIALNIAFIPGRGITGAAWATVIAEAVTVTLLYLQVRRRLAAGADPEMTTRQWRMAVVMSIALFVTYAYFYPAGGWNQNSRFAMIRAVLERQTLQIDAYQLHTGDRAFFDGHYYTDKAPGAQLVALLPVQAARMISRAVGVDPAGFPGIAWTSYVAAVVTSGIFTVIAALCIFWLALRWGASDEAALFAATALGVASPAWAYATMFMGHGQAAGLLMLALVAADAIDEGSERAQRTRAWAVGLAGGFAVVTEFQAAIPAIFIGLYALARLKRLPIVARIAAGVVIAAIPLLVYNALAFGSPLHIGYASEEGFKELHTGFFGITYPHLSTIGELLFGSYRGLLPIAPLMGVVPLGLWVLARGGRGGPAAVAAATGVYYLLLNASYYYWEGGWAFGPRQMTTALPFLAVGLAPLWELARPAGRRLLLAGWIWGAALTLIAVSTTPQPPASIKAPVRELLWPAFRDGDLSLNPQTFVHNSVDVEHLRGGGDPHAAWNLGELAGLRGLPSLLPLAVVWIVAGVILLRLL